MSGSKPLLSRLRSCVKHFEVVALCSLYRGFDRRIGVRDGLVALDVSFVSG